MDAAAVAEAVRRHMSTTGERSVKRALAHQGAQDDAAVHAALGLCARPTRAGGLCCNRRQACCWHTAVTEAAAEAVAVTEAAAGAVAAAGEPASDAAWCERVMAALWGDPSEMDRADREARDLMAALGERRLFGMTLGELREAAGGDERTVAALLHGHASGDMLRRDRSTDSQASVADLMHEPGFGRCYREAESEWRRLADDSDDCDSESGWWSPAEEEEEDDG